MDDDGKNVYGIDPTM